MAYRQKPASTEASTQEIVYRHRYFILAIVLIGLFMGALDGFMANVALPTITGQFQVSLAQSQWVITGYLAATTGLFIFFGKVSEHTGKTGLFMGGWLVFTLSSLACGLSPGLAWLIAFRVLQGIGYSMVSGVALAILYQTFPPQERGRAMGYYGTTLALGALLGPTLGGFVTEALGWRYIFLVNVPIGVVLLAGACVYLKIPEARRPKLEMEWAGAIALVVAVTALLAFCDELAGSIALTASLAACGAVFAASSIAFVFLELRAKKPLVDLSIFANRSFTLAVLSMSLFYVTVNMVNTIAPFYLQGVMGYSPAATGLVLMLVPLAMAIASSLGGWLYDRYHWRFASGAAMLIAAVASVLLGYGSIAVSLGLLAAGFVVRGIGSGLYQGPNNTEIMNALPPGQTAMASSASATARNLGYALGVSLASILLTFQLGLSGSDETVLSATPSSLAGAVCLIMLIAGAISAISAATSFARNYWRRPQPGCLCKQR